jgi:peptidoglycan/LPS O-acetylase OafA/YrhL
MAVAFCSLGTGTLLLALLLHRMVAGARVGPALLGLGAPLSFVSAFVHADPSNATTATTHGQIHILTGVATFVLMVTAMFTMVRPLRRNPPWRLFGRLTLGWAIAALLCFFLIPTVGATYFGLAQRIFLGTLISWTLAASWCGHRIAQKAAIASPVNGARSARLDTATPQQISP